MILCFEVLFVASRCIVQRRVRARVRTRAFFLREMERETGGDRVNEHHSIYRYICALFFSHRSSDDWLAVRAAVSANRRN